MLGGTEEASHCRIDETHPRGTATSAVTMATAGARRGLSGNMKNILTIATQPEHSGEALAACPGAEHR
ncbi:hypothetical protein GCM10009800_02730 [Nocardiopsis rhodophaea]